MDHMIWDHITCAITYGLKDLDHIIWSISNLMDHIIGPYNLHHIKWTVGFGPYKTGHK